MLFSPFSCAPNARYLTASDFITYRQVVRFLISKSPQARQAQSVAAKTLPSDFFRGKQAWSAHLHHHLLIRYYIEILCLRLNMELYAVGQNGWSQLEFGANQPSATDDVSRLIKVASGTWIAKPVSNLIYTIGLYPLLCLGENVATLPLTLVVVGIDGQYRVAHGRDPSQGLILRAASTVFKANGEHMHVIDHGHGVQLQERRSEGPPLQVAVDPPVRQIAASATAFVILHQNGTISTLGDGRFPAVLGRLVTEDR